MYKNWSPQKSVSVEAEAAFRKHCRASPAQQSHQDDPAHVSVVPGQEMIDLFLTLHPEHEPARVHLLHSYKHTSTALDTARWKSLVAKTSVVIRKQ